MGDLDHTAAPAAPPAPDNPAATEPFAVIQAALGGPSSSLAFFRALKVVDALEGAGWRFMRRDAQRELVGYRVTEREDPSCG
jgi:hypothetical protein